MRVITGKARGMKLKTPEGLKTRPTTDRVKEGMFNILQFELEGRTVLDLFAGTGQLGIEALSRGAAHAVFVDERADAVALIRENLRHTRLEADAEVYQNDYAAYLRSCRRRFDLVLLDPPYAEKSLENAMKSILEIDILSERGIIMTERPAGKPLLVDWPGLERSRDYRYGKTVLTVFRRVDA